MFGRQFVRLGAVGAVCVAGGLCVGQEWTVVNVTPVGAAQAGLSRGDGGWAIGTAVLGSPPRTQAVLWNVIDATWVSLQPAGATNSFGYGALAGQQVGIFQPTNGQSRAALWSGSAASMVSLHPAGASLSAANAISATGQYGWAQISGTLHASRWNGSAESWVSLNPPGRGGEVRDADGDVQVGFTRLAGFDRACMWRGSAASWVELHPAEARTSLALGAHGELQVGRVQLQDFVTRAALWRGSAASWVDLTPPGATLAFANGIGPGFQVGLAFINGSQRAIAWRGTANSWEDLSAQLPATLHNATARDVWSHDGITYVAGEAIDTATQRPQAVLWFRETPCDVIDFNNNGVFPEDQDAFDMLEVLAGGACSTGACNDIDFNNNGVFPEDQDVIDFFVVLAGGIC
jgi:hypothetical protein